MLYFGRGIMMTADRCCHVMRAVKLSLRLYMV